MTNKSRLTAIPNVTPLDALTQFLSPLRTHPFAYPALEAIHIVGIALLLGNLVLLELRVWGWGKVLPVKDLAKLALLLAVSGFCIAAASHVCRSSWRAVGQQCLCDQNALAHPRRL
jgi:hypothetical protein